MSPIAELYRELSGLQHINIDELISVTPEEELPTLYKKLIWNIQRGEKIDFFTWAGHSFADIIHYLADKTNIQYESLDPDKDNKLTYDDWRINNDLEFAHTIIRCEHDEMFPIYANLINESEHGFMLVDEEDRGILMTDNIKTHEIYIY